MCNIRQTITSIFQSITGNIDGKSTIIRVNNDDTSPGDFWLPYNLIAWRGSIPPENYDRSTKNILEYYLIRHKIDTSDLSLESIAEQAIASLISESADWDFSLAQGCLQRERVCLSLNRTIATSRILQQVLKHGIKLPKKQTSIFVKIQDDPESNLTTLRLQKLRNVSEKILRLQGHQVTEGSSRKVLLTTKSEGEIEDGYVKYICGVVKNPATNLKEKLETYESYRQKRIESLEEANQGRDTEDGSEERLHRIAEAILTFEMLGVRPNRPSFIDIASSESTTKGGAFVLYNVARIEAIFRKFNRDYEAQVLDADEVDFSLLSLEEEWSLVYNHIMAYSEVLMSSVQNEECFQLCTHVLCSFLSHLSQKFSVYYRRTRILTEEREHLIPTMMARLCLLKALSIVFNHALDLLDITPIQQM